MNRAVVATACLLLLVGGSLFAFKHWSLGMAIDPDTDARVWQLDFAITLVGDGRAGRVELVLPIATPRQVILDEERLNDGLEYAELEGPGTRKARWSGSVVGTREVLYSVRVHVPESSLDSDSVSALESSGWSGVTAGLSAEPDPRPTRRKPAKIAEEYTEALERLRIHRDDDPEAIIASVFGFVSEDIELASNASRDPRVVLRTREGNLEGKTRLLIELLRAAGIEARPGTGLRLGRSGSTQAEPYVEALLDGRIQRLLVSAERPDRFPSNFLSLSDGTSAALTSSGLLGADLQIQQIRESLPADEMAAFVSPRNAVVRALSLYRLPVATRSVLSVLLLFPLAALIASIYRNLVGIRTFGTFMPVLLALSLRETGLAAGLALIAGCLTAGVVGRLLLDRLRLLFVPRVCLLVCIVILAITGLSLLGHAWDIRDLASGLLFPIVILAMLIERISVTTLEEGWAASGVLLVGSLGLTAITYPIFQSDWLGHLFLGFPELVLCVMAGLVLVGGYTGYRISELWRFRSLVGGEGTPA